MRTPVYSGSAGVSTRLRRLETARTARKAARTVPAALRDSGEGWQAWVESRYPIACKYPFADRHVRLWEWWEALKPGVKPRPYVAIMARGGGKSTTVELCTVRAGVRLSRRFVLIVSDTQKQADAHVQSIGHWFEALGVSRAINRYGNSRGWRRDQLRTSTGFNVAGIGLDAAIRGVKIDEYRPDVVILDDIDAAKDTPETTAKKIDLLTNAILPAGSEDLAVCGVQNLVHEESIFAQLADGRADFLHGRICPAPEPAVIGLDVVTEPQEDGSNLYKIVSGVPTWEGQPIAACEAHINTFGLRAFLRECQHEVKNAGGYFFDVDRLGYCEPDEVPATVRRCRAWDLAATEGGGDHTAGVLMGRAGNRYYVLDLQRGQWSSDRVRARIAACALQDGKKTLLRLPQDPGQAGKDQAGQLRKQFSEYSPRILPVTGDKATRATDFAEQVNLGNVTLVRAPWNGDFREELRKFREDTKQQADDIVDAASDAFHGLSRKTLGAAA